MALAPDGTLRGSGHPPDEVSGFYHLQEAPWVLVMIAPGSEILAPVIQLRTLTSIFGACFIVAIIALIRWVVVRTTSDIRNVPGAALKLTRGEFGAPLLVKSRDEVGELTRSFNLIADGALPDPLHDLYLGGGFPETHGARLSSNRSWLESLSGAAERGLPIYAECGGLMLLSRAILWEGKRHEMAGVLLRRGGDAEAAGARVCGLGGGRAEPLLSRRSPAQGPRVSLLENHRGKRTAPYRLCGEAAFFKASVPG